MKFSHLFLALFFAVSALPARAGTPDGGAAGTEAGDAPGQEAGDPTDAEAGEALRQAPEGGDRPEVEDAPGQEAGNPTGAKAQEEFNFDDFEDPQKPAAGPARDPLMWFNRGMFHFNDKMYFWVLKPVARGYRFVMPKGLRLGVHRVFKNAVYPARLVGNVLQGKGGGAGRETARFLINSTVGVGGFFDPAKKWWDIRPSEEDFGQTLGRWGMGPGVPLMLPVVGPTNLRDLLGMVPDYFLNPVSYLDPHDPWFFNKTRLIVRGAEVVNRTSLELGTYESVKKDALDPYTFIRDAYGQMREQQVKE
jgi:phospholipid-binding lipoprotein MlaA